MAETDFFSTLLNTTHPDNHTSSMDPRSYESNGRPLLIIATALCGLSAMVVSLRLFTRYLVLRSFGKDDWCIMGSLVSITGEENSLGGC
jgi:hypothetical protein